MILRTDLYWFDVHNDGYFSHLPLTYVNGVILEMVVRRMPYEQFPVYLEEKLNLYLDHLDMDLSEYLSQAITNEMDACVFKKTGPLKKRYCNDFSIDEMVDWAEMEVKQHGGSFQCPKKPEVVKARRSMVESDSESEYDSDDDSDYQSDNLKTADKDGISEDPFIFVEKHVERYPMYDETTHWRLKKPKVGEKYVSVAQFKECLTYYDLANGFSLWYERSCKARVVAKCGQRPRRLSDLEKGKQRKHTRYPSASIDELPTCPWRCYARLADGWKAWYRKIIALDGCFLKSPNPGEILAAIGRDGNNHIYPVAWAVVYVENKDNCTWFLELLEQDLGSSRGNGLTLMFDQHKATSKASYLQLYNKIMDKIKSVNPNAHKYLMDKNPKTWSRAFFEVGRGCEAIENGFSESFNSVIFNVRHKPLLTMLEAISLIVLESMKKIREISKKWNSGVCPKIKKRLEWLKEKQRIWHVIPA
ncbi:multidrug resistance-associated protein 5 [Tanacetum coccineum]